MNEWLDVNGDVIRIGDEVQMIDTRDIAEHFRGIRGVICRPHEVKKAVYIELTEPSRMNVYGVGFKYAVYARYVKKIETDDGIYEGDHWI